MFEVGRLEPGSHEEAFQGHHGQTLGMPSKFKAGSPPPQESLWGWENHPITPLEAAMAKKCGQKSRPFGRENLHIVIGWAAKAPLTTPPLSSPQTNATKLLCPWGWGLDTPGLDTLWPWFRHGCAEKLMCP